MNYKNLLQEHAQQNYNPLPTYSSVCFTNENNIPLWVSTVKYNNVSHTSLDGYISKKEADQAAAKTAYNYMIEQASRDYMPIQPNTLEKILVQQNTYLPLPPLDYPELTTSQAPLNTPSTTLSTSTPNNKQEIKYHIFVDLENLPIQRKNIVKPDGTIANYINIHCFISTYSTVNYKQLENLATMHIIDDNSSQAVDHFMSFTLGEMLSQFTTTDYIIILSRDKSSGVLVNILKLRKYNVIHFKKINALECLLRAL